MNAIEVRQLRKTYKNGTEALKGVDISITEGDFFGLLGANGAGKTTLIGILCSLVTKTSGSATILGHDIDAHGDLAKAQVGIVPQEFNFSIFEKVWDIIITQAGYYGLPPAAAKPYAEELLNSLGLWEKRHQPSRTLSGGMKRRLMIARALVHKPKLLILDEPTAGVDVELRYGMWDFLGTLNKQGTTILLTTHYLEEAERLCRNLAIINKGTIVRQGSVSDLLSSVESRSYVVTFDAGHTQEISLSKHENVADVLADFAKKNQVVRDIRPQENQLERLFLDTIKP